MACAKGILGASTAGRGGTIFLWIITGAQGMDQGFGSIQGACSHGFARYEIELLEYEDFGYYAGATLLQEVIINGTTLR